MSAIILARHGRPAWDYRRPIPGRAFADWCQGEAQAPLDPVSMPSPDLMEAVRTADCIMTSPLRRSLDSARLLAPSSSPLTDPLFREADLPMSFAVSIHLRPNTWATLARSAWFCGWSNGGESFRLARTRAQRAAQLLISRTDAGAIAVVGHGMMNTMIAAELRRQGWRGPRIPSPRHWSYGVFTR